MSYQIDIIFWESSVIEYPISPSRTNGAHWCVMGDRCSQGRLEGKCSGIGFLQQGHKER
jgi:hypothetical protein